jgi:hypothetical protein
MSNERKFHLKREEELKAAFLKERKNSMALLAEFYETKESCVSLRYQLSVAASKRILNSWVIHNKWLKVNSRFWFKMRDCFNQ